MSKIVYKGSAKALRKGAWSPNDRFVFLGDGTVAVWVDDTLVQSDVLYKRPDSHCEATNEPLPTVLRCPQRELDHVNRNKIQLPFKLVTA